MPVTRSTRKRKQQEQNVTLTPTQQAQQDAERQRQVEWEEYARLNATGHINTVNDRRAMVGHRLTEAGLVGQATGAQLRTNVVLWLDQSGSMREENESGLTSAFLRMLQEELQAVPGARVTRINFGPWDGGETFSFKSINVEPKRLSVAVMCGGGTPLYRTLASTQPVLEQRMGSCRNANNSFLGILYTDGNGDDGHNYGTIVTDMWRRSQASGLWTYVLIDSSGNASSRNEDLVATLPPGSVLLCRNLEEATGPVREGIRRFAHLRRIGVQSTDHFLDGGDEALKEDALW